MNTINHRIADELHISMQQVSATIALMDEGNTVPFIARYRKEATGELSDTQLRQLDERLQYLRDFMQRRDVILSSIQEQGKLSEELKHSILDAKQKSELEDLYLPYKPRRRSKGQIAIESGLEPLAMSLLNHHDIEPDMTAKAFINADNDIFCEQDALDGARYILMEKFAEDAQLLQKIRTFLSTHSYITAKVVSGKEQAAQKYKDYFDFNESINKIPSHRILALFRGRNEGFLHVSIKSSQKEVLDDSVNSPCIDIIAEHFSIPMEGTTASKWLNKTVQWTWKIKILLHLESEMFNQLKDFADKEAIDVFANNLRHLLMSAPAGKKVTMGLDPGLRTGVKVVILDETGKLLKFCTIFPHVPQKAWEPSLLKLKQLCEQFHVDLISIGNGTGSRETDKLVLQLLKVLENKNIEKLVVSEAGASIYSASELAAQEFPDLDVTYRGAVSIGRRLQDPMAELVKIDPKSIGVGQYQHDVSQVKLSKSLDAVVEDCVNSVGVNLNTASSPLLSRISGLSNSMAESIVTYREQHGAFNDRQQLLSIPRLGPKSFEQAAGFLKIPDAKNTLDNSSVHPEAYSIVEQIIVNEGFSLQQLISSQSKLKKINPEKYVNDQFGLLTIKDILKELEKPGRDPRPSFKTATFKEGIDSVNDLKEGMLLEGVITNVTNFGAFVDIGVHQDGLVHLSMLSDKFVAKPSDFVKTGDIVKVRVIEVETKRQRIALSMKSDFKTSKSKPTSAKKPSKTSQTTQKSLRKRPIEQKSTISNNAMALALNNAINKNK